MDLVTFAARLAKLTPPKSGLRPFVCHGDPLRASVLIVGFNPATVMRADWWSFWSNESGFDFANWRRAYERERAERPLAPGKTRRSAVSATRRVVDRLVTLIGPERCVEANLFAKPSPRANNLEKADHIDDHLDLLLEAIRPEVVIVYGKPARMALEERIEVELPLGSMVTVDRRHHVAVPHFSRPFRGVAWTEERIAALAAMVR